jgi:hypothetical protein
MPRRSNDLYAKLERAITAWFMLRPNKTYAGFTLESFKKTVEPTFNLRQAVVDSNAHTQQLISRRADSELFSAKALRRLVSGVRADEDDGDDGELYAALGYMQRTIRNSLHKARRARRAAVKDSTKEEAE